LGRKTYKKVRTVCSVFLMIFFIFMGTGCSAVNLLKQSSLSISFDPKVVNPVNVRKFNEVRKILKERYYQEVDENKLVEGAIAGMAEALDDPYTVYFNKDQMKAFMEKSEGSYVGIGVSVIMDNNGILTIVEPFEDSPAHKAGLLQGDKIIKVDDKDVTGIKDENMIISMIKGQENTKVKITVYRPALNKPLDFEIIRKRIKIVNIKSEVMDPDIGYIKIIMFDGSISKDFDRELKALLDKGVKGLIIDLRDNPGGAYGEVVRIADRLLPEALIVYTKDRYGKGDVQKSDKSFVDLPLAILVNGNSASASEILAGAVKDNKRGVLVGTKTFGKGLVQEILPLEDGSGIKFTVSKYFTPNGVCIQSMGIEPDELVDVPEKYKNQPVSQIPKGDDIQLKTAAEILKAKIQ